MTRQKISEYVQRWMDSHEPDTFVRNEHGKALYTAKYSTLNIQIFFEDLLADFIEDDEIALRQPPVIKPVCEQQSQPLQTDIIIRFSKLPRKGLIADFSGVGLNQLVEFNTYDFNDLAIFDMQLGHINERAKELNANFVVYHMGSSDLLKSNTYMMKFTK